MAANLPEVPTLTPIVGVKSDIYVTDNRSQSRASQRDRRKHDSSIKVHRM